MDVPTKTAVNTSTLILAFWAWKLLLLLIAVVSPGPGYDTSTQILLAQYGSPSPQAAGSRLSSVLEHVASRLTRWDAIYFTASSTRGHVHEQEWAFSWLLARCISQIAGVFPLLQSVSPVTRHAIIGILISHLSHFLAVLALFRLTFEILPYDPHRKRQIAFTAACLHTISPAGLFLSAPYAESSFALFNFLGMLAYVFAARQARIPGPAAALTAAVWTLSSGVCFGQAAVLRSNGLLSGLIFLWDALSHLPSLPQVVRSPESVIRLGATLLSGIIMAMAFAAPQLVAYLEYCTAGNTRPWCERMIPSIYTWVQEHYWNVGFLRYWTVSNLPLLVLATPSVLLLVSTGIAALQGQPFRSLDKPAQRQGSKATAAQAVKLDESFFRYIIARLALPQVVLALLAITSYHAQVINRIASGYPVSYILLAVAIHGDSPINSHATMRYLHKHAQWIVRVMVMYAIVQGGLFASFLPPA